MKETDIKMLAGYRSLGGLSCIIVGVFHRRPSKKIRKSEPYGWVLGLPRKTDKPFILPDEDIWEMDTPDPDLPSFISAPLGTSMDRYWSYSQNDAQILGARRKGRAFELTINHYDIWRLACILQGDSQSWRNLGKAFPVTFMFDDLQAYRVFRIIEQGAVQYLRTSSANLNKRLLDIVRIEPVSATKELLEVMVIANGSRRNSTRRECNPYFNEFRIHLQARTVSIRDDLRQNWLKVFGEEELWVFDRFWDVWPQPGWAVPDFENWLVEIGALS